MVGVTLPEPTAEDRARIAARYPSRRPLDVAVGAAVAVILLTIGAIFVASGFIQSNPPVTAMVRAFEIAPQTASADIVVQRGDPSRPARCDVYAQAANFERVGEVTLDVPAGPDELTLVHVSIRTVREATTVQIAGCRITG